MPPRIAIPLPHSADHDYCRRALPQYEHAVEAAGGVPVPIPFDHAESAKLVSTCDAILLPGSNADVDPAKFGAAPSPHTAPADSARDALDFFLLDDAFTHRKPILGICFGLQSLNVYRGGSLIQHIPDFLPGALRSRVNHEAGRSVPVAHTVEVGANSVLARVLCGNSRPRPSSQAQPGGVFSARKFDASPEPGRTREGHGFSRAETHRKKTGASAPEGGNLVLPVNSSHHQSAEKIGSGLRVVARCPDDNIIEAVEGTDPDHFVIAVQWHPERSVDEDPASRAIFGALIKAVNQKE